MDTVPRCMIDRVMNILHDGYGMMKFKITSGRASGRPEEKHGSSCQTQQCILSANVVAAPHVVPCLHSCAKTSNHLLVGVGVTTAQAPPIQQQSLPGAILNTR